MKIISLYLYGITFSALLGLVGCGGGGGGSSGSSPVVSKSSTESKTNTSSLEASSNSSSSSSAISSSSSSAQKSVVVRGKVMAEGMAGGELSVTVGAHSYKTNINNQREYQITLPLLSEELTEPVSAIARGAGSNRWIALASLMPSVNQLLEKAGVDGVLEASEYAGTNISAITTAQYAYVLSTQTMPTNDRSREYALIAIDGVETMMRAAYLQRVLMDIDTDLPASYETTLAMMLDNGYVSSRIKILNAYDDFLADELAILLGDPEQASVSNTPLIGNFLVSQSGNYYLIKFHDDGTGVLVTSNSPGATIWAEDAKPKEGTFTWIRKGADIKLTLDTGLDYGRSTAPMDGCNQYSNNGFYNCKIKLTSLLLSLAADNDVGSLVNITLSVLIQDTADNSISEHTKAGGWASLIDRSKLYQANSAELPGVQWYTDTARYMFHSGDLAVQTNLKFNINKNVTWKIEDGAVTLNGETRNLVPLYPTEFGFMALELREKSDQLNISNALQKTMLIKRENVVLSESDWVGRWQRLSGDAYSAAFDYYSNGEYRDGFETKSFGSWSVVNPSRLAGLAGGTWRMDHEVLAIHSNKRYIKYCYGNDSENFVPAACLVEAYSLDKSFTGNIFWDVWSKPVFQEAGTRRAWSFFGHFFMRETEFARNLVRVGSNLLLDKELHKLLELRASDINTIDVCEYDIASACERGTLYHLTRAAEIKINGSGNGSVKYAYNSFGYQVSGKGGLLIPRDQSISIELQSASGYTINAQNISGCDGALSGNFYTIPARATDCEMSVTFTAVP